MARGGGLVKKIDFAIAVCICNGGQTSFGAVWISGRIYLAFELSGSSQL